MTTSINLADPGIWDDGALINSWNEALEEYKKYHSIHVQKQSLADVLTDEELLQLKIERRELRKGPAIAAVEMPKETYEDNEDDIAMDVSVDGDSNENITRSNSTVNQEQAPKTNAPKKPKETTASTATATAAAMPLPQVLLDSVQEESLRNVMMSWYYAGYYTGLYEGQQKAKTQG
ncbi:hypothetical protein E2P81_ATG01716 [Venturia nashicola]|uniref:Survival Motor Neuron Gemin2-binding domain-containing protein n=1 Tax=Venturia nashicola TaxID=86259 RepID=A0A4Z1NGY6_9PEZI|nr:hypothetical protein E6O75_ATG01757 [Venturia nashicola]TLD18988.1 hypothetical protein E2P81_ATG01716 [Venturia nashicola]